LTVSGEETIDVMITAVRQWLEARIAR